MARPRKISVGRIVTYTGQEGVEKAAIISRINSDGTVSLTVFDPLSGGGSYAARSVPASDWRWPELT